MAHCSTLEPIMVIRALRTPLLRRDSNTATLEVRCVFFSFSRRPFVAHHGTQLDIRHAPYPCFASMPSSTACPLVHH